MYLLLGRVACKMSRDITFFPYAVLCEFVGPLFSFYNLGLRLPVSKIKPMICLIRINHFAALWDFVDTTEERLGLDQGHAVTNHKKHLSALGQSGPRW